MLALESCGLSSNSQGLKFVWWWGTAPIKELLKKEIGSGMKDRNMDNIGNGYRLCVLGDLNGWIGDRV